ncbi:PMS1 protein homolog 1-like [Gigantopelta aegis]|uniref:PMS1 protein homolog 1-like n=1 Tax=Gigantopelta aegis TaxID=1735272 RepID=UPI001B88BFFE|nr:PMS1 protein homolog 1-like [Gigantopelta aegis]
MAGTHVLSALPPNTVRLIGSTQVITSVYSVIKELIENSLDAECTNVDIKLENYGLDRIEVRDNGKGICISDIPFVARRHYTSKITSHTDLERLTSYGFRGEALASLCSVADVSITTKTETDDISMTYTVTSNGEILDGKPSHLGNGTLIVASNLFKNLPVRKHYYNTSKKKKEELKKIEDLLMSFGVICPHVRLTLRHNKETVWQKSVMSDMKTAVFSVLGRQIASQLEVKQVKESDPKLEVTVFLPKPGSDILVTSRASCDRSFLFVNSRPVTIKEIEKLIRTYYCNSYGCDNTRHPVFIVSVTIPPNEIDVNIDPNKTKVMLHHLDAVKNCLEKVLLYVYGPLDTPRLWRQTNKDAETHAKEDNSEARALVSRYSRQLSEEAEQAAQLEDSTFTKQSQDSRPSNKCEVLSHSIYKSDFVNNPQGNADVLNYPEDNADVLNHPQGKSDALNHPQGKSDVLNQPQGKSDVLNRANDKSDVFHHPSDKCNILNNRNDSGFVDPDQVTKQHNDMDLPAANWEINLTDFEQSQIGLENTKTSLNCSSDVSRCKDKVDELVGRNMESNGGKDDKICSDRSKDNTCEQQISNVNQVVVSGNETKSVEKDPWWVDTDSDSDDIMSMPVIDEVMITVAEKTKSHEAIPSVTSASDKDGQSSPVAPGSEGQKGDAELWSRGQCVSVNGKLVQPVSLLSPTTSHMPGKRPASPLTNDILPPEKRRSAGCQQPKPLIQGQATLFDIVGDHAFENESGFNVFSKEVRSAVLKQNLRANDEEINNILREKWENMPEDERRKYSSDVNNRNTNTLSTPKDISRKVKKKLDKGRSVRDQLLSQMKKSTKKKKKVVEKPTKDVFFNQNFLTGFRQTPSQNESRKLLIGCLRTCGMWVCSHGNELLLMNPHRIAETILYHRLMETHQLSADHLEKPVPLSASAIGNESLWNTLMSLAKESWSHDPRVYIRDNRIVANGLKIECHKDSESEEVVVELVGVSKQIPMFGVRDLCEILELITNTGATTLPQSRPLKVINYLKSEAVRMARQSPAQRTKEDMAAMLSEMDETLPADCSTCLHNKPFFHKLSDISQMSGDGDTVSGTQISQE